jgi:hypothetical protein
MSVEVRLRVPNMKQRALSQAGYPIDHQQMRFRNVVEVTAVPKPNDVLELPTQSGRPIDAKVVRVDDDRGVVSCQFARSRITWDEYEALASDPESEVNHLLA